MGVLIFISGMIFGAALTIMLVAYLGKKALSKRKEAVKDFLSEFDKLAKTMEDKASSLESRLNRVREITEEQFDLQSHTEGPQKNAMDGKYKNRMGNSIKSLEEEKQTILKSILADGYDPKINVMSQDGSIQEMKLSEFMAYQGIDMTKDSKTETNASNKEIVKAGKFVVYKGGKDDGEGTSH